MSGEGTPPDLRDLTPDDRAAMAEFSCRAFGEPWTDVIESMVREKLATSLALGESEAIGLWSGDELIGVAAWQPYRDDPNVIRCVLIAVRTGHQRRGHARALKHEVLMRARGAGARVVMSDVHWDNDAMINLNVSLGANVTQIPGDDEFCRCTIHLGDM